jgi:hypothetical protein
VTPCKPPCEPSVRGYKPYCKPPCEPYCKPCKPPVFAPPYNPPGFAGTPTVLRQCCADAAHMPKHFAEDARLTSITPPACLPPKSFSPDLFRPRRSKIARRGARRLCARDNQSRGHTGINRSFWPLTFVARGPCLHCVGAGYCTTPNPLTANMDGQASPANAIAAP